MGLVGTLGPISTVMPLGTAARHTKLENVADAAASNGNRAFERQGHAGLSCCYYDCWYLLLRYSCLILIRIALLSGGGRPGFYCCGSAT